MKWATAISFEILK